MTQYIERKCETESCQSRIAGRAHKRFCSECLAERNRTHNRQNYHLAKKGRMSYQEKALEYQREYRKTHPGQRKATLPDQRIAKTVITGSEFLHVPPGKTEKILAAILKGQVGITR